MSGQPTIQEKRQQLTQLRSETVEKTKDWVNQQLVNETNRMYGKQLSQEFRSNQKVMDQDRIIKLANIEEQRLNIRIIICISIFWIVLLSGLVLVLFYMHIINLKYALIGISGIWGIGFIYLGYYLYKHISDPETTRVVNDARDYSRAFLRAAIPNALIPQCPAKCKVSMSAMNAPNKAGTSGSTTTGLGVVSEYPMDHDYWSKGIPSPVPGPRNNESLRMTPGQIVVGMSEPLQTFRCVKSNDPSKVIETAQPCSVYPGYESVDGESIRDSLEWGMTQTMFPRKE